MAEGSDHSDEFPLREGQSQQNTPSSSTNSLPRSAQDLRGIELETSDSSLGDGSSQQRPASLPELTEPHRELLFASQPSPDCAASDDASSEDQAEASESPTSENGSEVSAVTESSVASVATDAYDQESSSELVQDNVLGRVTGAAATASVCRHESAPARYNLFQRKQDSTAAGTGQAAPTPVVRSPSPPMGSGVQTDAMEGTTAAIGTDVNNDAAATSLPKGDDNDEEAPANEDNAAAAIPEAQQAAAANENAELLAAATAVFAKPDQSGEKTTGHEHAANLCARSPEVTANFVTGIELRGQPPLLQRPDASLRNGHSEGSIDTSRKTQEKQRSCTLGRHSSSPAQSSQEEKRLQQLHQQQQKPAAERRDGLTLDAQRLPPAPEVDEPEDLQQQQQTEQEQAHTSEANQEAPELPQLQPAPVETPSMPATEYAAATSDPPPPAIPRLDSRSDGIEQEFISPQEIQPRAEDRRDSIRNANRGRRRLRHRLLASLRYLCQSCTCTGSRRPAAD
ncbi:hypothetical protein BOX15_Mlig027183g1 [Macrostomum lignano]|uniref:RING-type domain-containing protein n=2 Tax=Macrostomum lignano TaxID=282301 RepID=A0A1I8HMN5_9PLAT|nr:hypothetical protein BOX15_Mlig027183g1 [Macrostomum lignano]